MALLGMLSEQSRIDCKMTDLRRDFGRRIVVYRKKWSLICAIGSYKLSYVFILKVIVDLELQFYGVGKKSLVLR